MKQSIKVRTLPILFLVVALLAGMLALRGTPAAHAAGVIVVNSAADSVADDGVCSLREAITAANSDTASGATAGECAAGVGADSITFAADYTITLAGSQLPAVTSELTITGNGAANSIIEANAAPQTANYRVFEVASTGNLTLDGVTIRHGHYCLVRGCPLGGGIRNDGTLSVTNSTLSGNSAYAGGGIFNNGGTLTVTNSTLSGNSATYGGGIYNDSGMVTVANSTLSGNSAGSFGGGIFNTGNVDVTNSTLSGNSAGDSGGGIFGNAGTLSVTNSTISGNTASGGGGGTFGNRGGGGIFIGVVGNPPSTMTLTLSRSLVSGNATNVGGNYGNEINRYFASGTTNADDFNVFGHSGQSNAAAFVNFTPGASDFNATSDGSIPTALTDILDTTLADNGGPTFTHALVAGSPAIDFAGTCGLATDQRGVLRPQGAACDAGAFELEVSNQPPTAVAGGPYLVAVGSTVAFDGSTSSDPDNNSLTETWSAAGGSVSGATYTAGAVPGIYDVCLTVNDGTVDSESNCTFVVVYDPSGGFVTGGGWIDSPAGAYTADPSLSGKATFGFVAKYKKGANVPDGNTEFQFKAGDLNFKSSSYEWLVVAGSQAMFKGEGTINGEGSYKFMITADDGSPDTFRIKIWYEDGGEVVVYDNGSQQSLGGGNIVVHKGK